MEKRSSYLVRLALLFVLGCSLTLPRLFATHGMGADITYQCVAPGNYLVTLTFFRDCAGIIPATTEVVTVSSFTCGVSTTLTLTQPGTSPIDVTPICPSLVSACVGGANASNFGIQQYTYQGLLTLPVGCGDDWVLGWSNCCRNFAISTLNTPGNQSMYVAAELDNTLNPCNNSPIFNNIPTPIVCVNQPVVYNHGVTDPDGDSLVFSLANCFQDAGIPVGYAVGFNAVTPLATAGGISINPQTGEITFTPDQLQIGVICVRVEEYRNGVKIGETVRDMQFSVTNCNNTPPVATGVNGNSGQFALDICVGANSCFDIQMSDPDGDLVFVTWNGGIPGGTFSATGNGSLTPTGTFCWTPTANDVGSHFFTVTVRDDNCPLQGAATYAFTINVVPSIYSMTAGPDTALCQGEAAILTASAPGAISFSWTPATGLSATTGPAVQASPSVPTVYTVTATYPDGCGAQAQVQVSPLPGPAVSVNPGVAYLCPGNNLNLNANSASATSYLWSNGATGATINVSPASSTAYEVVATDANGCRDTATAQVLVNTPNANGCELLYVSPNANGSGSAADPARLTTALSLIACNNGVIKMDTGTYVLNAPLTGITGNVTLEGGFIRNNGWEKTSQAGATRLLRNSTNPEGPVHQQRLVAVEIANASNFRLQDLTIQTVDATLPGMSTYGLHLSNCQDYDLVRVQILVGDAMPGENGADGVDGGNGGNGQDGEAGADNNASTPGDGGNGGNGGGFATPDGLGGPGGSDVNGPGACCLAGEDGGAGIAGLGVTMAGGGGGGGGGGEASNAGGDGGNGGNGGGGAAGGNGGNGGNWGNPGGDGGDGINGANGLDGNNGAPGPAPTHVGGWFVPGLKAGDGQDGGGGAGGGGGGAGGGQDGVFFDGAGGGGGSGGGGGEGGTGGEGGRGGGAAFGIYLVNNGANARFDDCFVQVGAAGQGGQGGVGGIGGVGGLGGSSFITGLLEVGFGGLGGDGGDGGNGGDGGDGQPGISQTLYLNSGQAPTLQQLNINLAAQPVIRAGNVACTGAAVTFTRAAAAVWNFGAGATPATAGGTNVSTSYATTGRKTVTVNGVVYQDFFSVLQDGAASPIAESNAPQVSGVYRLCAGETADFSALNAGSGYEYHWDFDNAVTPSTYDGPNFSTVNNLSFTTPGTYDIQLRYETDCCGLSVPYTITLVVDEVPNLVLSPDASFCAGTDPMPLTATGGSQYTWAPLSGLSAGSGSTVMANPTSSTVYAVTALNAAGTCFDTGSVSITVADLQLSPSTVAAGCTPNGSVSVAVAGGSGTYQYNWQGYPANNTPTLSNVASGLYEVLVTDQVSGCADSTQVFLAQNPGTLSSYISNSQPVTCTGGNDGTATVTVAGNTQALAYTWTPAGGTGATATGLAAGTYSVTITEALTGCETVSSVTIPEPPAVSTTVLAQTDPTCSQYGTATVNASGGNGPFTYVWNTTPVTSGPTANGLEAQTYEVIVTDQDGCADTLAVPMNSAQSPVVVSLVQATDATACGIADGSITVAGTGSGGNLTYQWVTNPPQTGPTATNLFPGAYTVTVTGSNGCDDALGVTLGPTCVLSTDGLALALRSEAEAQVLQWAHELSQPPARLWLERAVQGQSFHFWRELDAAQASGSLIDQEPFVGMKVQYRMWAEDASGRRWFSSMVEGAWQAQGSWKLLAGYPNPTESGTFLEIWSYRRQPIRAELLDARGRSIKVCEDEIFPGKNSLKIDLQALTSGMYQIRLISPDEPMLTLSVGKI